MSHPNSRIVINKPVANRSPSPDISSRHILLKTQPVQINVPRKSNQKVPMIQQIINLHNENRRLKELLASSRFGDLKKELQEKEDEIKYLKSQLPESIVNRRLFGSDRKGNSIHQSLRESTDRKRKSSEVAGNVANRDQQNKELRQKVNSLLKQNQQLRKTLLMRTIRSDDHKQPDYDKVKKQTFDLMNKKIEQVESYYDSKIKDLNDRIQRLVKITQKLDHDSSYSNGRLSNRIMQVVTASKREGSAIKRDSQRYETPHKSEDYSHIEAQLTVSKNNIKQLQKQNEGLLQDNLNMKKAYELLLKKTNYTHNTDYYQDTSLPQSVSFETQSQLNRLSLQNKSLKQTLQDLRSNTASLENENQQLRVRINNLQSRNSINPRYSVTSRNDKEQSASKIAQLQKSNILLTKQKDVIKKQLFTMNTTNQRLLFEARSLQEQNIRLKEQNEYLRNNITDITIQYQQQQQKHQAQQQNQLNKGNSKLQQIWNQLTLSKKKIQTLELRNKQLEKELLMKEIEHSNRQDKDEQIFRLKDELNKALTEQKKISLLSNGENDDLRRQLSSLRTRLSEADKMLEQVNDLDANNKKEVSGLLRGLEEVKRMLDRISFESLEVSLRDVGFRYKTAVEQRIQLLRRLKQKTNDGSRIQIQNIRLKRQIVDINTKYINQKSNRQLLESKFQHQMEQSRILKQQINQLNRVVNEYIVKKIDIKMTEDSRVKELEVDLVEDQTEKDIGDLRELENQVRAVGAKLEDVLRKAHFELQGSPIRMY